MLIFMDCYLEYILLIFNYNSYYFIFYKNCINIHSFYIYNNINYKLKKKKKKKKFILLKYLFVN